MTAKLTRLRSLLRETIRELGVRSPLHDVGLTKAEIRALSREMGLPTAEKPSFACLASLDLQGTAPAASTRRLRQIRESE